MDYIAVRVAIQHCLDRCTTSLDGRDAKEWALAAAVLIDKYMTGSRFDTPTSEVPTP